MYLHEMWSNFIEVEEFHFADSKGCGTHVYTVNAHACIPHMCTFAHNTYLCIHIQYVHVHL